MASTKHGYRHMYCGKDMDGTDAEFEWIELSPHKDDPEPVAGWFALCEIEPEAGWLGPFDTEEAAVHAATTEEGLMHALYGDDPMGDHQGRNE